MIRHELSPLAFSERKTSFGTLMFLGSTRGFEGISTGSGSFLASRNTPRTCLATGRNASPSAVRLTGQTLSTISDRLWPPPSQHSRFWMCLVTVP